jgi:hypothetical protein
MRPRGTSGGRTGLQVSLLPFIILLSAFASARVDDDIALRLGLNQHASGIVSHLFTSSPAVLNAATLTSLLFVAAGTFAVAGSLQQIYEKAFRQDHRGMRDLYRPPVWVAAACAVVAFESLRDPDLADSRQRRDHHRGRFRCRLGRQA